MLVLSRKRDESIFIGNNVKVTVIKISGDRIRLGIDAPKEVVVRRGELVKYPPDSGRSVTNHC